MLEFANLVLSGISYVNEAEMRVEISSVATNSFDAFNQKINYSYNNDFGVDYGRPR